jgi:hypothetical protein
MIKQSEDGEEKYSSGTILHLYGSYAMLFINGLVLEAAATFTL